MGYDNETQRKLDERIFRLILSDYLICKERNLTSALDHLEREVTRRLNRINDMTVNDADNKPPLFETSNESFSP